MTVSHPVGKEEEGAHEGVGERCCCSYSNGLEWLWHTVEEVKGQGSVESV